MDNYNVNDTKSRIQSLLDAKKILENALNSEKLNACYTCETIEYSKLIEFGDRISYSQSPPLFWKKGMPLLNCLPPAPQIEQMKQGKLADLQHKFSIKQMNDHVDRNTNSPHKHRLQESKTDLIDITVNISSDVIQNSIEIQEVEAVNRPSKKARVIQFNFDDVSSESDSDTK
jgi:hypothetical protein